MHPARHPARHESNPSHHALEFAQRAFCRTARREHCDLVVRCEHADAVFEETCRNAAGVTPSRPAMIETASSGCARK